MGENRENVLLSKKLCANLIHTISKLYIYIYKKVQLFWITLI